MVDFSNLIFLYILLPVIILVYFLFPEMRQKNWVILAASLLLYSMGNILHLILLVALCFVNWKLSLRIDSQERSTMLLPVGLNLLVLAVFKYAAPFLNTAGFGMRTVTIAFPLGLSLVVLSAISYFVDVYSGRSDPEPEFTYFLLYMLMFSKLVQGPIVRYERIFDQLENRKHHPRAVFEGLQRFLFGLAKKLLLADHCGMILTQVNDMGADTTLVGVWFAGILFLFRIYYELSGYADMAIGLGKIFGFHFPENFNRPFLCLTVKEFWGSWNMTLGSFFRDYLYLPLGGKEMGNVRRIANLLIVCLAAGLWHGAGLHYVLWGLYIFAVLVLEESLTPMLESLPDWVCRCVTLWFVLLGWIIFSNDSTDALKEAGLALLGYGHFSVEGLGTIILRSIPLLLLCFFGCTEVPVVCGQFFRRICGMGRRRIEANRVTVMRMVYLAASVGAMLILLYLCTVNMVRYPVLPGIYTGF